MPRRPRHNPTTILRQCNNPLCRKWYDAKVYLLRQGRGLYCHRQCGWGAQRKFKWTMCEQCNKMFRRNRSYYRKRATKFCCFACYLRHRKGIKTDEDWRSFPLDP